MKIKYQFRQNWWQKPTIAGLLFRLEFKIATFESATSICNYVMKSCRCISCRHKLSLNTHSCSRSECFVARRTARLCHLEHSASRNWIDERTRKTPSKSRMFQIRGRTKTKLPIGQQNSGQAWGNSDKEWTGNIRVGFSRLLRLIVINNTSPGITMRAFSLIHVYLRWPTLGLFIVLRYVCLCG